MNDLEQKYLEIRKQYIKHFGFSPKWQEPSSLSYERMIELMFKAMELNLPIHKMLDSETTDPSKIY